MSDEGFELQYIHEAFEENYVAPLGKNVDNFEKELARYIGIGHATALSSGTAAMHMALRALGIDRGDVVFCQSLTFAASANPIVYQGACPVFIDSDDRTWNMSPAALETALKKYRPKAVIVVHLYGLAADLDPIIELCNKYGVPLIEDAAESLGTTYKDRYTGTFGDFGIFSFNGNKIITTSGGGMLVSENAERIAKVHFWATQSRDPAPHYQHSELGFNYRLSNICAGIGRGQLRVLNERIAKKRYIFEYYRRALSDIDEIEFMPINDWNRPNCWLTCIQLKGKVRPEDVRLTLEAKNIESRPLWKPMHLQPFYKDCDFVGEHVADKLFENGLCLPSDTKMTDEDLYSVVSTIRSVWR